MFVDVVNAFASLLRRIVFSFDEGDEAWLSKLRATGFTNEDVSAIYESPISFDWEETFSSVSSENTSQSKLLSYRLAEQIYTNSWVSQEYLKNIIRVTRGSSAGYPLADLVYSLAMARVLLSLRSTLADTGLQSSIGLGGG